MPIDRRELRARLLEALAIVTSILLAFAIDAAWEQRIEAQQAEELLTGLRSEFEFQRTELVRFRDRWAEVQAKTERLLASTGSEVALSPVAMDSLLLAFLNPSTFDPRTGTLEAAKGSGQLGLIGSRELRDRLAGWDGVVAELQDNEAAMREFILAAVIPYLADRGVPVERAWSLLPSVGLLGEQGEGRGWPGGAMPDSDAARVYASLVRDPEFGVLVGTRYMWLNVEEYVDAIVFVDELLALIEVDLER